MIDRALLREIDWVLIGLMLAIALLGIALIVSSSHYLTGAFAVRQGLWLLVSLGALFATMSVDYKVLAGLSPYLFGFFILLLGGLLVFGGAVSGARSWLVNAAFFGGQPSELAKIALILVLARVFSEFKGRTLQLPFGLLSGGATTLAFAVIGLQPDLGTAVSLLPILGAALVLAGLVRKTVILLLVGALAFGIVGWNFVLKDYQKKRIETLVSPSQDPRGAGYHVLQSKIAIGSGGFSGKGFMKGTQSRLRFLPARHTDFIFSVFGEEFGFLGVAFVFLIYFLFLARLFASVPKSRDRAGAYIIFMVACLLTFQFLVNVMMIVGLFPVTGVPIPLLSYGGSSLLTTFVAVGLALNVKMRRYVNA